jgi:hypothetical protein
MRFVYGTLTRCGATFQNASTTQQLCNSIPGSGAPGCRSHDPEPATPPGFDTGSVWADPVSLAATQGVAVAFLSSGY